MKTTVLIPAYNNEATLGATVESALSQTVSDLEVVVVDDASTVPVTEVLSGFDDERLRVLRHDRNRGTAWSRSTALGAARTELVSQLDADDTWEPTYLETVLPRLEDPRVGLVYSNCTLIDHPLGWTDYMRDLPYMPNPEEHPIDTFPRFADQCPVPALTTTMRREAAVGVGGYARWLRFVDDYDLYLRLVHKGWRFAYVDERLANYRWPTSERGQSFDARRQARYLLLMWVRFAARHPRVPGPKRQIRTRLRLAGTRGSP